MGLAKMVDRTGIVVLGMHRSGTSALTRMLNLLGASLPHNLYPPGPGNELGHWEPEAAVSLHDRILAAAGTSVNHLVGPSDIWFQTSDAGAFVDPMKRIIVSEYGDAPLFVLKDPRASLVLPLWKRAFAELNIRLATAVISRNPVEVAKSLADRQTKAMPEQLWPLERGGLLWLRYMLAAERHSRGSLRSFCLYPSLLQNWRMVATRLATELHLAWPRPAAAAEGEIDAFLSDRHRHQRASDDVGARVGVWSSWIAPVFQAVQAADAGGQLDESIFDTVGEAFERTASGGLVANPPADVPVRGPEPAATETVRTSRRLPKTLCLVGHSFRSSDDGAELLRSIGAAAANAHLDVTVVHPDPGLQVGGDADKQFAGRVSFETCASSAIQVEPSFLRPTIASFRHLRDRQFDIVLFEDDQALGFASTVAKQTGMAFETTLLGVVAFGSSRWKRETAGRFPSNPVPIATDFVERKAIEFADLVICPSRPVAQWMERTGWIDQHAIVLPDAASPTGCAWDAVFQQLRDKYGEVAAHRDGMRPNNVTIVIPHFEQPALLDQNLEALTHQTDGNFCVLVVDDGSQGADALSYLATVEAKYRRLNLRLLRQDNRYLGAARNAGIRAATTDYIILLDDDNIAFPEMVETLRRAIHTANADVVTCGIRSFRSATDKPALDDADIGPDQFFSAGPVLLGAIHNCFGDASGIYRKTVFDRVGYFHELHGVTYEDWQMHLRVVGAGLRLLSLPEPLVWYRVRPDSMLRTTRRYDNARVIAATVNTLPCAALDQLADYLMGSEEELVRLNTEIARLTALVQKP